MRKLTIIMIFGIALTMPSFANGEDKTDKLNKESGYTFSPGYVNAAKYQAESIKYQKNMPGEDNDKGFFAKAIDIIKNSLGHAAKQQQAINENLNLAIQQKSSGTNQPAVASSANQLIDLAPANIAIGTGTNQVRDGDNRLISEIMGKTRYVYAGFENFGTNTIANAIAIANEGDKIIVKSGGSSNNVGTSFTISVVQLKDGVSLYGGYGENGVRDAANAPTVIRGVVRASNITKPTEISGFYVISPFSSGSTLQILLALLTKTYSAISVQNSSFVSIRNCTTRAYYGVEAQNSNVSIYNSKIEGTLAALAANKSYIISRDSSIKGLGMFQASMMVSMYMKNTGYGVYGINSTFVLLNSSVSSYSAGLKLNLTQNSQVSYTSPVTQQVRQNTDISSMSKAAYKSPYDSYGNPVISKTALPNPLENNKTGAMLKDMIKSKEGIHANQAGQIDPELLAKMLEGALSQSTYLPGAQISPEDMELAMKLASILANPTEDQKAVIDSVTSLLNDLENLQKEIGANPELQKASSDLLQMVANVLLAQAIPDLLKEGDLQGIKGIFSQLDSSKGKVILEYKEATKPYYEEVKKLIEKNASVLDIDLNLKNLIQKELKEIPRSEIDKILEKLKAKANKSFEEEYILQQEEKAKAKYIDPNKKKLENDMKKMLEDFTKKLATTLETKK